MVDTVIFRVHDLHKNEGLVKYLEKIDSGKKKVIKEVQEKFDPTREIYLKKYYSDLASGKTFDVGYDGFIRSSHYDAVFYIHYQKDYIEFNISLPKYWFGHNVFQLIDHFYDEHVMRLRHSDWWESSDIAFNRFRQVFNVFLEKDLAGLVEKTDIEIYRIDFCFNLIFNTQHDAEYYLQELKTVERPRFATTAEKITNYKKGLYFPSKEFTFKIYHKGEEFLKHSYRKYSKQKGKEKANQLLEVANRTLRYEIEMRRPYLSRVFFSSLRRSNKAMYRAIQYARCFQKNSYIVSEGKRFSIDGRNNQGALICSIMTIEMRRLLRVGQLLLKRDARFFLRVEHAKSAKELAPHEISNYLFLERFDREMFYACLSSFKKYFVHFQLGSFEKINTINYLIQENKDKEFKRQVAAQAGLTYYDKVNIRVVKQIMEMLKDHSWDQIKEKGFLSRATFYRYKKFFRDRFDLQNRNSLVQFKVNFTWGNYYDAVLPVFSTLAPNVNFPK